MPPFLHGPVEQTVQDARFDEAQLTRLSDYYARLVDSGRVQSAGFLMARGGKVFAHQTTGRLSHEPARSAVPYKPDSIRRIYSISKIVCATAAMRLVDEGRLWLEQSVASLIPEFDTNLHRGINVRHLLTHTSGLRADGGYFSEPYPLNGHRQLDSDDWLKTAVLGGPLQSSPGSEWSYSTVGYAVLGEVVARASGQPYHDFVEENIFQPLGMTRSFLRVPAALRPEVAVNQDWELEALGANPLPGRPPNAGAGVYSTLSDLNTLAQVFLGGGQVRGRRVLSKKSVQEMTRNQLDGVPAYHWGKHLTNYRQGLGWGFFADGNTTGPATFNHEGWGWCSLFVDPVEQFVFAAMLTDSGGWDPLLQVNPRTMAFSGLL